MLEWLLARRLRRLGVKADPSPVFVSVLEKRLRERVSASVPRVMRWRIAFSAFSTSMFLLAGTGAYAYASDAVLPDHPLYPVRTHLEGMEEKFAITDRRKATVQVKHLGRRLHEQQLMVVNQELVPSEQVERFVESEQKAIEHTEKLPEQDRERLEKAVSDIEEVYFSTIRSVDGSVSSTEGRDRADGMLKRRNQRIQKRLENMKPERREQLEQLFDSRRKPAEQDDDDVRASTTTPSVKRRGEDNSVSAGGGERREARHILRRETEGE